MLLSELIEGMDVEGITGSSDVMISDITYNSCTAKPGSLFVAMKGAKADGHDFVRDAVERGARAVVSGRPVESAPATNIVVTNTKVALGMMSSRMFGDPSGRMKLVGVTGTNGKTTTTYIVESILRCAGYNPGVIGTVEYRWGGRSLPAPHTTPFSLDLQKLLADMSGGGCDSVAMEVSSHALDQDRVWGSRFDVGIFTNLTPEHLDYHERMEDYFEAKAILFERLLKEGGKPGATAVINADDSYGARLMARASVPIVTFGRGDGVDVRCSSMKSDMSGIAMTVRMPAEEFRLKSRLRGSFNVQNILAAVAASLAVGIDVDSIRRGVESLASVPGRFEAVDNGRGVLALVDYSHTPDALEKALMHAKELAGDGKLIAVFGCGGDRDRRKRPLMGSAAARISDFALVTSDNPRTEDPNAIIEEILPGVTENMKPAKDGRGYEVIPDRREAISRAAELAGSGDVIVVAGKGHEDYQILGTKRIHFDDREVLAQALGQFDRG